MDDETIRRMPEGIYWDIYARLAALQGAASGREAGFSWTDSPHPVWGRACFDLDLRGLSDEALAALARKARELGCRVSTGPRSMPGDAEAILESAGFRRSFESAGMVLRKEDFRPRPLPAGLQASVVGAGPDWLEWSGIVCRNLFDKESAQDAEAFAKAGMALAKGGNFRAYLGRDGEGRAVATSAALECKGGTGGVFFVAVEPDARRRGYGAALTAMASADCFASGYTYACLSATEDGHPVYLGLGYRDVSVLGRYLPPDPVA